MKIGISQENELRKFQTVQISEVLSCLIKQGFEVLLEMSVIIVAGYDDVVYRNHLVSFLEWLHSNDFRRNALILSKPFVILVTGVKIK